MDHSEAWFANDKPVSVRLVSTRPNRARVIRDMIAGVQFEYSARLPDSAPAAPTLMLLDSQTLGWDGCIERLKTLQALASKISVALVDVDDSQDVTDALKWPILKGVFVTSTDDQLLAQGLATLLKGDFWFSREHSADLAAMRSTPAVEPDALSGTLSRRELDVLRYAAEGLSNADIAKSLQLSPHTVKTHLYNLYRKLGVENRTQAVNWYQSLRAR
ncbi:MAG: response regulator transcription factor [Pontibacterium sp.]